MSRSKQSFGRIPSWFIVGATWAGLTPRAQTVLVVLLVHTNRKNECFPSRERILQLSGLTKAEYVRDGLAQLEKDQLIQRKFRASDRNTIETDGYVILFDLDELPFGRLPYHLVDNGAWASMSKGARALLVALLGLAGGNESIRTPKHRLAKTSGIGRKENLDSALHELTDLLLVTVEETDDEQSGKLGKFTYHLQL